MKLRLFETLNETAKEAVNTGITCGLYGITVGIAIKLYTGEAGYSSVMSTVLEYGLSGVVLGVAQKAHKELLGTKPINGTKPRDEEYNAVFALFVAYHLWNPVVKPMINMVCDIITPERACHI